MKFLIIALGLVMLNVVSFAQSVRKVEVIGSPLGNASSGEVAVVQSTGLVYTAGQAFGGNVGVIDPSIDSLIKVIRPLDLNNATAVFYSRVNQTTSIAYFLRGSQIEPVDGRASSSTFNQFLPTITFNNQTVAVFAIDQTRNRMYVATRTNGATPAQSQVHIIDINPSSGTFHQILSTVALPAGLTIGNIAVNRTTNKIYTATLNTGGVYFFDGTAQTVSLISGTQPGGVIVINEVSNTIYAGRSNANSIQAIDGATNTLTTNIAATGTFSGTLGEHAAVNSTTERVYVLLSNGNLTVIDAKKSSPTFNTIQASVGGFGSNGEIAVDEGLNKIVVASRNTDATIINGATNEIIAYSQLANMNADDVMINPITHRASVGYTFYTTQTIFLDDEDGSFNIGTINEIGEGVVNSTNNSFYFPNSSSTSRIRFLNQAGILGTVSGLGHGVGRYIFSARNSATNRFYFTNSAANIAGTLISQTNGYVAVVNGATNSVIAKVEVGGQPFSNPAVNEATNKIYQMNAGWGIGFPSKITVINGATNTAADVNISAFPANTSFLREPAVNPTTNKIYFRVGEGVSIGVINGATDVATPLAGFTNVFDIKVNPTLNRIYLLTATGIRVLNGADDTEIANIALASPTNLTINQTTGKLYVRSFTNPTLSVIDPNTNTVITNAALPAANTFYSTLTINEATNELYLGAAADFNQENTSSILFINGDTLAVRKTLAVPLRPSRIFVNPATQTAYATTLNASQRNGVVIISTARTSTLFDFDGDGKSDQTVFRPSNGTWYLNNSTNGFSGLAFGFGTDIPMAADYDGDGKTDVAVFRPSNGTWYLQRSTQGFAGIQFGTNGDLPVAADYDGDGKADIAVFRPSNGYWYRLNSSNNGFVATAFGTNGDKPVPQDYDGDGKADIAVYRPSDGGWYLDRSAQGFIGVQFGSAEDKPTAADYDGDGKADIGVFRPSNGGWYRLNSSNNQFAAESFGASDDLPSPADYDGDGRTDIGVFRPSNGAWYRLNSLNGQFNGVIFGANGDFPVQTIFAR